MNKILIILVAASLVVSCNPPLNNPYPPNQRDENNYYSTFYAQPKTLDPARAYSTDEYRFIQQIYEPPLQYHYLKRPYRLEPLTARTIPQPRYYDSNGNLLSSNPPAELVHRVLYEITLQKGILYQNHPCFAQDQQKNYRYHALSKSDCARINQIRDFTGTGTRELKADDYIYQIKRLADPRNNSPIFPIMSKYILGLDTLAQSLATAIEKERNKRRLIAGFSYNQQADEKENPIFLDYQGFDLPGVIKKDDYTFHLILKTKYPQILYWLAMPFFSPLPWEADRFYSQGPLITKNITLQSYPVGTGPFSLAVFDPNLEIILERNDNFHQENYPSAGESGDSEKGYLIDAGKPLPFIDKLIYKLERESIPRWNKFLQGYFDASGIPSDSFDQAIAVSSEGLLHLTDQFKDQGIRLLYDTAPSTFYFAFNMHDPVVGGYSIEKQKLRQALSIVIDMEERIDLFSNGRGIAAQGPLPPGIFGHEKGVNGVNMYVYDWNENYSLPQRKPVSRAQQLLAEAGYPNGLDPQTGKPLIISFDNAWTGPESQSLLKWLQKQFQKIGVLLEVRTTDYNRFQEKIRAGNFQFFSWGWHADYPDPENFLFLLYGSNGKQLHGGENAANYDNPEFNQLFKEMENMENTPLRLQIIHKMLDIVRRDAPWIWGFHPQDFTLYHQWVLNAKPNAISYNTLKYMRIDPAARTEKRVAWNQPVFWPLLLCLFILTSIALPVLLRRRRQQK